MNNIRQQSVEVIDYDPTWPAVFETEALALQTLIGDVMVSIHHIGSTAVPGLAAKPIVDILLEVTSLKQLDAIAHRFIDHGYQAWGEYHLPGRRYFTKGIALRTHHVHSYQTGDTELIRHIAFRDYLIAYPEIAAEYTTLKRQVAAACQHDIELYCDGKDAFIKKHEPLALADHVHPASSR